MGDREAGVLRRNGAHSLAHHRNFELYVLLQILETRPWTLSLVKEGEIIPGDTNGSHQSGATAMGFSFSVDFGHNDRPSISTPT